MRILIAGAGQIGVSLAKYLRAEKHEIILVDRESQVLSDLSEDLDIQTVVGNVAVPSVLERAGIRGADIFLAVTGNDEVNVLACMLAKKIFQVSRTVARVSSADYQSEKYNVDKALSVDVMVSPELETARQIITGVLIHGATDMTILGNGQVRFLGIKIRSEIPLVGKSIHQMRQKMSEMNFSIMAVVRNHCFMDLKTVVLKPNDEVYFFADTGHLSYVLDAFGCHEENLKDVVLFGGGNIGYRTAQLLEVEPDHPNITVVERNKKRAEFLAENLSDTLVIHGDGFDTELVNEIDVQNNQICLATTDSDENNVLLSLMAKKKGVSRTCALVRNGFYQHYLEGLGVDLLVNPNAVMVSAILRHLRHGRLSNDYFLQSGLGEVIEMEALKTARIVSGPLGHIKVPSGVMIGGVLRQGIFIRPRRDLRIKEGDQVFVFVQAGHVAQAEKLFTVHLSFFG